MAVRAGEKAAHMWNRFDNCSLQKNTSVRIFVNFSTCECAIFSTFALGFNAYTRAIIPQEKNNLTLINTNKFSL